MELRKDYILDRWVIIAPDRGKRPEEFKSEDDIYANDKGKENCFFCPGNESKTPPELGRIKDDSTGKWKIRWFQNKFPAVDKEGSPAVKTDNTFFTYSDAYGDHQVIVDTPDHSKQMTDLSEDDIMQLLRVFSHRVDELGDQPATKYVSIFKNSGPKAGTSIIHSHCQLITLNKIPPDIQEKLTAMKRFSSCPYCEIIKTESKSLRHVHEDDTTITFTPYASRFNFEVWIFPKHHYKRFSDFSEDELFDVATALKRVLRKLKELNANFNIGFFYAPEGEDLHFHIEIMPRIANWAGFELSTGVVINVVSPEDAAKFYKGESKPE
ncbi:MAG: galactose-1-phosphate uridylyltransferase [Candidatus Woesearchaeota archaeon]